jgi:hypothetical protein
MLPGRVIPSYELGRPGPFSERRLYKILIEPDNSGRPEHPNPTERFKGHRYVEDPPT